MRRSSRRSKRRSALTGVATLSLVMLWAVVGGQIVGEQLLHRAVADAMRSVEGRLGRAVSSGGAEILDWRTVVVRRLSLAGKSPGAPPVLRIERVVARLSPGMLLGRLDGMRVTLEGPTLRAGSDLAELAARALASTDRRRRKDRVSRGLPSIVVRDATVVLERPRGELERWDVPFAALLQGERGGPDLEGPLEIRGAEGVPSRLVLRARAGRGGALTIDASEPIRPAILTAWLGREISFRSLRLGRDGLTLRDVEVSVPTERGLEVMTRIDSLGVRPGDGLGSFRVELGQPQIRAERFVDGTHNLEDLFRRVESAMGPTSPPGAAWEGPRLALGRSTALRVRGGALTLVDHSPTGDPFTMALAQLDLRAHPSPNGYELSGSWNPGPGAGVVAVSGRIGAGDGAAGDLDLRLDSQYLDLSRLGAESSLDLRGGRMGGALEVSRRGARVRVTGRVRMEDVGFRWSLLSTRPLEGVDLTAEVDITLDEDADRIVIDSLQGSLGEMELSAWGQVHHASGEDGRYDLHFAAGPMPANDIARSLPTALRPHLPDLELEGHVTVEARARGETRDLETLQISVAGEARGFEVVAGAGPDVTALARPFMHQATLRDGGTVAVSVDPAVDGFTPYSKVSRHMRDAIISSEDIGFWRHKGFDFRQIGAALARNLEAGRIRRGGSTITQQLVKNLYLGRQKTIARKLEEAFLAWRVEGALSKRRILEVYLNIIEWAPGVHGIGKAAAHYFGKRPSKLSLAESAFLASILPNPRLFGRRGKDGRPLPYVQGRVNRLLQRMQALGKLSVGEVAGLSGRSVRIRRPPTAAAEDTPPRHALLVR